MLLRRSSHSISGRNLLINEWAAQLGVPFYEAVVETNAHTISLVFSDLRVDKLAAGATPFVVEDDEPDAKVPPE